MASSAPPDDTLDSVDVVDLTQDTTSESDHEAPFFLDTLTLEDEDDDETLRPWDEDDGSFPFRYSTHKVQDDEAQQPAGK